MRTLGAQNVNNHRTKQMVSALKSHALHTGMSFWTPLWLEMKHGVFTTLLNPSNSHCNGTICIPPEPKNLKLQFQWKKSWRPFSSREKAFSWSTSCLLAEQLMPLHIVTPWHRVDEPFKTKGGECHATCACSKTTCSPIPYTSALRFWKNSSGIYWTIRHTARTLHPAISTFFFT